MSYLTIVIAIKLGEFTYFRTGCKIPDWLQFKVNQYILNNTEKYNSEIAPAKNINLASIYNRPNDSNGAFSKNNNSELNLFDNYSIFAVDHLKFNGLEIKNMDSLTKVNFINSKTKHEFINL